MKHKFMEQINDTFGGGGMTCSFSDKDLTEFYHFLRLSTPHFLHKIGTTVIGRQPQHEVWVLGPNLHIDQDGHEISADESPFVWLSHLMAANDTINVSHSAICPQVNLPLELCSIVSLAATMKVCLKHN